MLSFVVSGPRFSLFAISFLAAGLVYFYPLSHFTLSIDGEFQDNFLHTIALGRWGHSLLRAFLLPEPFTPYFTHLIALLTIAYAAVMASGLLKLSRWAALLFCIVFVSMPQLAYQLHFINQADTFAIGYLLAVLGVIAFLRVDGLNGVNRLGCYFVALLAWTYALAIYQALIVIPPLLFLAALIANPELGPCRFSIQWRRLATFMLLMTFACLLYLILAKSFQLVFNDQSYDQFNKGYLSSFISMKGEIGAHLNHVVGEAARILSGQAFYGSGSFIIVTLAAMLLIVQGLWKNHGRYLWEAVLLASILLLPFIMAVTSQYALPARMLVGMNCSAAILLSLLIRNWSWRFPAGLAGILLLLHTAWITQLFSSDSYVRQHDVLLANRIVMSIYQKYPDIDFKHTPVYFHGGMLRDDNHKLAQSGTFGSSFFAWDGGNNIRLKHFLDFYGLANIHTANRYQTMQALKIIDELPTWPNPNSIYLYQGVLVIKLAEKRGWLPFSVSE